MKQKMIKMMRDIPSSFLLMTGFCLTMLVTLVSCELIDKLMGITDKTKDSNCQKYYVSYSHSERIIEEQGELTYMYVDDSSQKIYFDEIYDIFKENKLNFGISNFVYIGEGQEIQRLATYIYTFDDTYPFTLEKKSSWKQNDEPAVVIGESIKEYTEKLDGREYLYMNGRYYQVAGVLVNTGTGGYDSTIYILGDGNHLKDDYEDVEEAFQIDIWGGADAQMLVYGTNETTAVALNHVKEECEKKFPLTISVSTTETVETEKGLTNLIYENLNKIFMPLLFVFCINGCYSISYLWIKVRKYDIAVKYTFGYSHGQIYLSIIKEMCPLIGISVVLAVLLKFAYDLLIGSSVIFSNAILYHIAVIAGSVMVTLLVTSVGAYRYSKKIIPAEVLKEL